MVYLFKQYINYIVMVVSTIQVSVILTLISFYQYLILSPLKILFWRFHIYLLSNYVSHPSYAYYFHLRGLEISFYLLKLISDVSNY